MKGLNEKQRQKKYVKKTNGKGSKDSKNRKTLPTLVTINEFSKIKSSGLNKKKVTKKQDNQKA